MPWTHAPPDGRICSVPLKPPMILPMAKTKLNMRSSGDCRKKASASTLMPQAQLVGSNVSVVTIKDSGHW